MDLAGILTFAVGGDIEPAVIGFRIARSTKNKRKNRASPILRDPDSTR
jgi:hypothetical protein